MSRPYTSPLEVALVQSHFHRLMQSPKFPIKRLDIEEIINPSRLRSRWHAKVREAMRHQPISDPVEYLDFHIRLDAMCSSIAAEVCSGRYIPRPPIRFLSEKSKGMCRQLVIPSAKDSLVLQTLSDALWEEIKQQAPAKDNAFYAPDDNRFSKIIRGESSDYGPLGPWLAFQRRILGFATTRKYVIVTDIANFYDSISYDHLRHILAGLSIAKEHSLDLLIYILSTMLWQPDYMPRIETGLPQINLDAPRLLAHCFLFEIDKFLRGQKDTDFARYMDDIDLGVNSVAQGKRLLRDLDLALQTRQIRLNSGKTVILDAAQAKKYFRIRENQFLSRLERAIKDKLTRDENIDRERRFFTHAVRVGLCWRQFDIGSGEKILKRLINYARQYQSDIDDADFFKILIDWPACRSNILQWWQHSPNQAAKLDLIRRFVRSHEIVDDHALIAVANALVAAPLPTDRHSRQLLADICACFDGGTEWGFCTKLWLLSKYGTAAEIMRLIETSFPIWVADEHLSRLVAGMFPRLRDSRQFGKFKALVSKSGNPWCQSVMDFHEALSSTRVGFTSIYKFIRAPNSSLPNGISHAKFLMLSCALRNPFMSASMVMDLRNRHSSALKDETYRRLMPAPTKGKRKAA